MKGTSKPKYFVRAYYTVTVFQSGHLDIGVYDEDLNTEDPIALEAKAKTLAKHYQHEFLAKPDVFTVDRLMMGTPEISIIPVDDDGEPMEDQEFKI